MQRKKNKKAEKVKGKKKKTRPTHTDYDDDDQDLMDRCAEQAKQGSTSGGRKTCLNMDVFGDDVEWFKPKAGERYNLDIIPFRITEEWYKEMRQYSGLETRRDVGKLEPSLIYPIHRNIGSNNESVLCINKAFGKDCPICECINELYEDYEKNKKSISPIKVSWRCLYNVKIPGKKKIYLWDFSFYCFERILREAMELSDTGSVPYASLKHGKTLVFKPSEKDGGGYKFVEVLSIAFADRKKKLSTELLDRVYQLDEALEILTYNELKNKFEESEGESDFPPDDDEEEDDIEEEDEVINDSDDDDEEDDEEDDDSDDDDEEDDEEDEEDDEEED